MTYAGKKGAAGRTPAAWQSSGGTLSASLHPPLWVAAGVKYRNNDNAILFDHEENLIRKSAGQRSAKVLVDKGKSFGCMDDAFKCRLNGQQKVGTQSRKTFLVPNGTIRPSLLPPWAGRRVGVSLPLPDSLHDGGPW